jgi:hypothetical protein
MHGAIPQISQYIFMAWCLVNLIYIIQWVAGSLPLGAKRLGRESDHSPISSAEVKECVELFLHSAIRLHGVVLS